MRWAIPVFFLLISHAAMAAGITLGSTDIKPNGTIPTKFVFKGFGCEGENVSPELHWSGAPSGTKSFALTVYDPDAPTGSGWWHWVVYNISASVTELGQGASTQGMPAGAVQNRNDFATHQYGGPCPPKGDQPHHYVFTVFAVDVPSFDIPAEASAAFVGFNLHFHTLAKASFTARYGR